jgi:HlyD family secretion protein
VVRDLERPERPAGSPQPPPDAPRDEEGVYLLEGGKVRFQRIETGLIGDLSIEVLAGLEGGETVVSGPFKALRVLNPGDAAVVEKPKAEGEGRRPAG